LFTISLEVFEIGAGSFGEERFFLSGNFLFLSEEGVFLLKQ